MRAGKYLRSTSARHRDDVVQFQHDVRIEAFFIVTQGIVTLGIVTRGIVTRGIVARGIVARGKLFRGSERLS